MPLAEVLEANRRFLSAGEQVVEMPEGASKKVAIVTCMDGRLNGLVEQAMGFARGEAAMIRVAGATMAENDEILRSLVVAAYVLGVEEVYVVGHTDCGTAKIDTFAFTEAMRARGVSRDVLGYASLRDWLGAFSNIKDSVIRTVEKIKTSGVLPKDTVVHGLVIDTHTGELKAVEESQIFTEPDLQI